MDGPERCGGGKEHSGKHEPDHCEQVERILERAGLFIPEGRIPVGNEGPDADHVGAKIPHIAEILDHIGECLSGRADHDPAADLIAQVFEIRKAALAVFDRELLGMQVTVMGRGRSLLPQQVSVSAGVFVSLIGLSGLLSDRERDRAVRIEAADGRDDIADLFICVREVFSALQDKSPKAQRIPLCAAVQDLFFGEPVALSIPVAPADAAIAAVIAAVIGELNEAAQIYVFAVILFPDLTGCPVKDCFLGGTDCLGDVIADPDLIRAGAGGPL